MLFQDTETVKVEEQQSKINPQREHEIVRKVENLLLSDSEGALRGSEGHPWWGPQLPGEEGKFLLGETVVSQYKYSIKYSILYIKYSIFNQASPEISY